MRAMGVAFLSAFVFVGGVYANPGPQSEILIKFRLQVSTEARERALSEYQLIIVKRYSLIENLFLCSVPSGENAQDIINHLNQSPDIEYAELNQRVEAL